MGKRRKTLKEKMRSDQRNLSVTNVSDTVKTDQVTLPAFSSPSYSFTAKKTLSQTTSSFSLRRELVKTLAVSASIAFLQLALFLLLVNHTITLPVRSLQY